MDTKTFDQLMSLLKFLIVTVGFGFVTLRVNSAIQMRELEIKELEQVGKYLQMAVTENIGTRKRFAEYFATVTRSEELKNLWRDYAKIVGQEYEEEQKRKLAEEAKARSLEQQITKASGSPATSMPSEVLEKERELARTLAELNTIKRELAAAPMYAQQAAPSQQSGAGWVYLGEYDNNAKKWTRVYYDINKEQSPAELRGKTLKVTAMAANVRESMPTDFGAFGAVTDNLKNGTQVTVNRIQEWRSSGYMWAAVSY